MLDVILAVWAGSATTLLLIILGCLASLKSSGALTLNNDKKV